MRSSIEISDEQHRQNVLIESPNDGLFERDAIALRELFKLTSRLVADVHSDQLISHEPKSVTAAAQGLLHEK
jgi:hypothetical protein